MTLRSVLPFLHFRLLTLAASTSLFFVAPRSYVACGFPHNRVYPHRINVQIVTKAIEPSWDTRECRSVRCRPCYVLSHL